MGEINTLYPDFGMVGDVFYDLLRKEVTYEDYEWSGPTRIHPDGSVSVFMSGVLKADKGKDPYKRTMVRINTDATLIAERRQLLVAGSIEKTEPDREDREGTKERVRYIYTGGTINIFYRPDDIRGKESFYELFTRAHVTRIGEYIAGLIRRTLTEGGKPDFTKEVVHEYFRN